MAVNLGTLFWAAEVQGAERAADQADKIERGFNETARAAEAAEKTTDQAAQSMDEYGAEAANAEGQMDGLNGTGGRLRTSLLFLTGTLLTATKALMGFAGAGGIATAIFAGLKGALTLAAAGITKLGAIAWGIGAAIAAYIGAGLNSALAGTFVAGIAAALGMSAAQLVGATALGLTIGGLIVAGLEEAGVLDAIESLGGDVRDALGSGISDALLAMSVPFAPLTAFGGFVSGFVEGALEDGIIAGIEKGFERGLKVLQTQFGGLKRTAANVAESGGTASDQMLGNYIRYPDLYGRAAAGLTGIANEGQEGFLDIRGFPVDVPFVQSGGMVQKEGIAQVHKGEAVIPESLVQAAKGSGGAGVQIGEITVEIGDQTLDLSTLSLAEREELASMIAEQTGRTVENIVRVS